jgi:hypothetical protein
VVFDAESSSGARRGARRVWRVRSSASSETHAADSLERAVTLVEFMAVQAIFDRSLPGRFYLHAALAAKDGTGVLLVGPPMAGKSTLACALWDRGWSLLSDDGAMVHGAGSAAAVPRRVSLRSSSRGFVAPETLDRILASPSCCATGKGWLFHPHEIDRRPRVRETRVESVFFLGRRDQAVGAAEARPLEPAQAALALLSYGNLIQHGGFPEAIRPAAEFAGSVRSFDLGRGPLAAMAKAVERTVEASRPRVCAAL